MAKIVSLPAFSVLTERTRWVGQDVRSLTAAPVIALVKSLAGRFRSAVWNCGERVEIAAV